MNGSPLASTKSGQMSASTVGFNGTWSRPSTTPPTTFRTEAGDDLPLAAGSV